ncbi:dsDNA-specific endonuclease/ATPase MutS2 [Saonia flava]|uniref:DsDNA-specific endonuclease/ATPase MutS2 n=1 Tax=Saonia flava TaxID=523696 RepID=A0A846QWK7_9FLAO|nr:Smr/MutS family protein [Saonia flava]NJB72358.1 dsDNA-specific endonuclease/ATPase MutS2 [Saonia flava]
MNKFKIGERVEVLDDTIEGIVMGIDGASILVETDDGFHMSFSPEELIGKSSGTKIRVTNFEVAQIKKEKESNKKPNRQVVKPKERNAPKMEVDLHIHQLAKFTKGMSNHEMLNLQLETAKRQLDFAIRKRIQKVVFIHGVGEGILKEELYYLFKRYDNVKYYDADYQKYGMGATEVYIYQNL